MGVSASLTSPLLTATPGDSASCEIQVRNTGQVVDQYALGVLGDAQDWATVEPEVLNLYPGEARTALLTFSPPRSSRVHAGVVPFGLRIASREDPQGSQVEEGQVEVLPFEDVRAELTPHVAAGRTAAKFDVAVDNLGNHPVDVDLYAEDEADQLKFRLARTFATVEPGTATLVRVTTKPRKGFLRGKDKTHPFMVIVAPKQAEPLNADGSMVQRSLMPGWLIPAVAALVAVALVLTVLWFTVLKPAVQSTAQAEAEKQNQQLSAAVQQLRQQAAAGDAAGGTDASGRAKGLPGSASTPPAKPAGAPVSPAAPPPAPTAFRMQTDAAPNAAPGTFHVTNLPSSMAGKPLSISDILLQNPNGDTGDLQIRQHSNGKDTVLLEVGLANFRDLDYHLIQAWELTKDDKLQIAVSCQNGAGKPNTGACSSAVSFSGLAG